MSPSNPPHVTAAARLSPSAHQLTRRLVLILATASLAVTGLVAFAPPAAAEPECLAPSFDFDRDNTPDPVIGAPGSSGRAGSVQIRLTDEGTPRVVTIPAPAGAVGFGSAVASVSSYHEEGDDELCSQLAIGAPGETVGGRVSAGAVYLYTFRDGAFVLRARYAPGSNGVPGVPQTGARFGAALAAWRYWDDQLYEPTRLWIGVPGQDVGTVDGAGAVTSFRVEPDAVTAREATTLTYQSPGVPGDPSTNGALGTSLSASGNIVAVGAPGQRAGGVAGAGEVLVLTDNAVLPRAPIAISQASAGVPGTAESGDRLGAAVHLERDPAATTYRLLIGGPGEDVTGSADAGTVVVARLDAQTLNRTSTAAYDQDSPGVAGSVEPGDRFGAAVSTVTETGSVLTLLVGTPGEDVGRVADAGMVQVIGRTDGAGWTQNSAGVPGTAEAGDRLGASISASVALSRPVIGIPGENGEAGAALSDLPTTGQSGRTIRLWGGVPSLTGQRFGTTVGP